MKILAIIFAFTLLSVPANLLAQHVVTNPYFVEEAPVTQVEKDRANSALELLRFCIKNGGLVADHVKRLDPNSLNEAVNTATELEWICKRLDSNLEKWLIVLSHQNQEYIRSGKFNSEAVPFFKKQASKMRDLNRELKSRLNAQKASARKQKLVRTFDSEVKAAETTFSSVYSQYRSKALSDKRRGIVLTTETQIGVHLRSRGARNLSMLDALAAVNAYMDVYGVE
jgi:hypothetical protein